MGGWFGYIVLRIFDWQTEEKIPTNYFTRECFLPLHTERVSAYVVAAPRNKPNHISITKKIVLCMYHACAISFIPPSSLENNRISLQNLFSWLMREKHACTIMDDIIMILLVVGIAQKGVGVNQRLDLLAFFIFPHNF